MKLFKRETIRYLDDRQALSELDRLFPSIKVTPTTTTEEIMFNSGQRDIIDFIKNKIQRGGK